MAWTTPPTKAVGDPMTAALWNTYVRDNSNFTATAKTVSAKISSTTVTIATGAAATLAFDTEDFDSDGYHSVAVNTSRLTVPAGLNGKYRIWALVEFGASAAGHRSLNLKVNGIATYGLTSAAPAVSSGAVPTLNGSRVLSLIAGDYVELQVFQDSGGALTVNANGDTRFGMDLVGF